MNSVNSKGPKLAKLKVAIVHDWLVAMGGAERCLECFCEIFPEADIYTLFHKVGSVSEIIGNHPIHTSFLQKFPGWEKYYRYLLPLMPVAIEQFDLSEYDLVLSSSWCVAKGIVVPPETKHICYMYTPMRYIWDQKDVYFDKAGFFLGFVISLFSNYMRIWDVASVSRVDSLVAISEFVERRIKKYYRRTPDMIIHPPVDIRRFNFGRTDGRVAKKEDYFLLVTRFEPNKRADLALDAFCKLGLPLKIVGETGRYRRSLERSTRDRCSDIEFLGWRSDEELAELYSKARALVFPGVDDFGIIPLEAMASGTPVIAYAGGGALETVIPANPSGSRGSDSRDGSPNGVFFYEPKADSLAEAVEFFCDYDEREGWDVSGMKSWSDSFSRDRFRREVEDFIADQLTGLDQKGG